MLDWPSYLRAELVWGALSRGIALVYLISFVSLSFQVLPIAGSRGIAPIADLLRAMRAHFASPWRFLYFPTLLWISARDGWLRALPLAGVLAACMAFAGGPWTPFAFLACHVLYLSLDRPMGLVYPWDCLLFEAGFWAIFLPATQLLPELGTVAAPLPALAWVYRFLLFRVMFGFGKQKFLGSTLQDSGFMKGFMIRQPLPTPLGWLAHKLPMSVHKLALALTFVVEVPLSFTALLPGPWSVAGAFACIGLMLVIAAVGNYGYFNLLTIVIALSCFDTRTPLAFTWDGMFSSAQTPWSWFVHGLILVHTSAALLTLPFNTWCAFTWTLWPLWLRVRPHWLTWPVSVIRALQPLRWLHAYGVFPPRSAPGVKLVPVLEVSWDGQTFEPLRHRFSPTSESTPPRFCAPHHARLDQAVVYEVVAFNETGPLRNLSGRWDPYGHAQVSGAGLLVRRVLEGGADSALFFDGSLDESRGPPLVARARTYMLEPTTLAELRQSGRYWKQTLIGPHFPARRRDDRSWDHPIPPPELWHFEDVVWQRRSRLGESIARVLRGENAHALVLVGADDIRDGDVERFWGEFVPGIDARLRVDWSAIRETVNAVRDRYDRAQLYRFERLLGRYAAFLVAACEPLLVDRGPWPILGVGAPAPIKNHYHLGLLSHHIIGLGRATYDQVLADPRRAAHEVQRMTLQSGALFQTVFRYETLLYHSQKYRLLQSQVAHEGRPAAEGVRQQLLRWGDATARRIWGAFDMMEFLSTQFRTERDVLDVPEQWPSFELTADQDIRRARASTPAVEPPS